MSGNRGSDTMMGYGYGYGGRMSGWGYAVAGLGSLLLWVALVLGTVALVRHLRVPAGAPSGQVPTEPEQVLGARYARGDIDDEEYHRRLDNLRNRSGSAAAR